MKTKCYAGLLAGLFILGTAGSSRASSLIITGVIDGPLSGGTPKAVELYARSDINDLSVYGLGFANNGGGSDGKEYSFPAVPASGGDFLYVASGNETFFDFFGFTPDAISSAVNINGDDAVELFRNTTVVDVFGNVAEDGTGQSWDYLDGWAYRNDAAGGLDSALFIAAEWHFSGINVLDGETANLTAAVPFPAGSFSPGAPPPPVPVPEPATLFLLGAGIAGMASRRLKIGPGKKADKDGR